MYNVDECLYDQKFAYCVRAVKAIGHVIRYNYTTTMGVDLGTLTSVTKQLNKVEQATIVTLLLRRIH